MSELTHLDKDGRASMVDVGHKDTTSREAVAEGSVYMAPTTLAAIRDGAVPKGDVLSSARIAGIMAAKRTPDLIPLCHPLPLTKISVEFEIDEEETRVIIVATVRCQGRTGVEMEALTAVSVAALTIYDMAKALEKNDDDRRYKIAAEEGGQVWRLAAVRFSPLQGKRQDVNVRLILFAGLRQAAGFKRETVALPEAATVGDLLESHLPNLRDRTFYVAVNEEFAQRDTVLQDGDEVALLPPVSGGESCPQLRSPGNLQTPIP